MRARFAGLWRHPDFLKLWTGQTISVFGSLITRLALPFTAVLMLGSGPLQVGLLTAAEIAPGFLFGLVAGVWVDRLHRRSIMIATDLGRAALLASIPVAAWLHLLRIEQLYLVALLTGLLARRHGVGRTLIVSLLLIGLGTLLLALAGGPMLIAFCFLIGQQLVGDSARMVYEIHQLSLRQAVAPERLLGRVNASMQFTALGAVLVGSLLGGVLGQEVGLRPVIVVAVAGILLSPLWLLFSPVRSLRRVPGAAAAPLAVPSA